MDIMNASKLPQRGYSKEKRCDLKIIGLALMVSTDFHVPLFHQTYAGNIQDAKQFGRVIEQLTCRCQEVAQNIENITLVFDKGNNSINTIKGLTNNCFHYVNSLTPSHHTVLRQNKYAFNTYWFASPIDLCAFIVYNNIKR
jgi:transposase